MAVRFSSDPGYKRLDGHQPKKGEIFVNKAIWKPLSKLRQARHQSNPGFINPIYTSEVPYEELQAENNNIELNIDGKPLDEHIDTDLQLYSSEKPSNWRRWWWLGVVILIGLVIVAVITAVVIVTSRRPNEKSLQDSLAGLSQGNSEGVSISSNTSIPTVSDANIVTSSSNEPSTVPETAMPTTSTTTTQTTTTLKSTSSYRTTRLTRTATTARSTTMSSSTTTATTMSSSTPMPSPTPAASTVTSSTTSTLAGSPMPSYTLFSSTPGAPCSPGYFLCVSGKQPDQVKDIDDEQCISQNQVCDGLINCLDGADELSCTITPDPMTFSCQGQTAVDRKTNSRFIPLQEKCDGFGDCTDLSDERNCACALDDYQCASGYDVAHLDFCIEGDLRCNGHPDCSDGSDELDCPQSCHTFSCFTQNSLELGCLQMSQVCDGHVDCVDGSDERNGCSCMDARLWCLTTMQLYRCIQAVDRCDRVQDCQDGSDEVNCTYSCPPTGFMCTTGTISRWPHWGYCLAQGERCNGVRECTDGSDELNCGSHPCGLDAILCTHNLTNLPSLRCLPLTFTCDLVVDCRSRLDEFNCSYKCAKNQFKCENGVKVNPQTGLADRGYCLADSQRCDGVFQCMDHSDEFNCSSFCPPSDFACINGTSPLTMDRCIPQHYQCDREPDCLDGSDELNCTFTCPSNMWACKTGILKRFPFTGYCIYKSELCDSFVDCSDGSDEYHCPARNCSAGLFRCANGLLTDGSRGCIHFSAVCDRHVHCMDASDELASNCSYQCPVGTYQCTSNQAHEGFCQPMSGRCNGTQECSDGSDETNCTVMCERWQFKCTDGVSNTSGSRCIDSSLHCDKVYDCTDKSDELTCNYTCPSDEFMCASGVLASPVPGQAGRGFCIKKHFMCDNKNNCEDQSDESDENCEVKCSPHMFRCVTSLDKYNFTRCIPGTYHCDRQPDCLDGSDEHFCTYTCPLGQFKCEIGVIAYWPRDTYCISEIDRCDGRRDCEDNSDEKNCGALQCRSEKGPTFVCAAGVDRADGGVCIPSVYVCDKVPDCTDSSDEYNCTYTCPAGMFTCQNGSLQAYPHRGFCLYPRHVCDGVIHCMDSSDEQDCQVTCSNSEFKCKSGGLKSDPTRRCLPAILRCDQQDQCMDASDETGCIYHCKPGVEFRCENRTGLQRWPFYGRCIPFAEVCDRFRDCYDGSDESAQNCGPSSTVCPVESVRCPSVIGVVKTINSLPVPCILSDFLCDRVADCTNGTDESFCNYTCPTNLYFTCATDTVSSPARRGFCVPVTSRCNGVQDCVDGSDEMDCRGQCVNSQKYHCGSGTDFITNSSCISPELRCDGTFDCQDHSDEINCG